MIFIKLKFDDKVLKNLNRFRLANTYRNNNFVIIVTKITYLNKNLLKLNDKKSYDVIFTYTVIRASFYLPNN